MGNGESSIMDLNEGDIFLTTHYNKIGYWWGVSVYDLDRQGWFPSIFVQPYTGEVPEEATKLESTLKANFTQSHVITEMPFNSTNIANSDEQPTLEYNIVTNDASKYKEYDVTTMVVNKGRRLQVGEKADDDELEQEDFDYEQWAKTKAAASHSTKRSRKT